MATFLLISNAVSGKTFVSVLFLACFGLDSGRLLGDFRDQEKGSARDAPDYPGRHQGHGHQCR